MDILSSCVYRERSTKGDHPMLTRLPTPCPRPECRFAHTTYLTALGTHLVDEKGSSGYTITSQVCDGERRRCMKCGKCFDIILQVA